MKRHGWKREPELFPISLSGVAAKTVVNRYAKNLSRTMPSKIEIECTKAGIEKVLALAEQRVNALLIRAKSKRQFAEIDEAELREFAAKEFNEFIAEVRGIL